MAQRLKLIGLTGGIGSGKSTVARLISGHGIPVIDADQLARAAVAPGQPANADIAAAWPQVMNPDGTVDRKRLAALVFADPTARARLEAITHPRIQALAEAQANALAAQGHRLAFYEASQLVESGRHHAMNGLVVVAADVETQLRRAMARDGANATDVRARMAAQLPLAEKIRAAHHVIDNNGDLAETEAQVAALLAHLTTKT